MARPLKPFVRSGGYYPSAKYTPLVYPGGYTTLNAKNGKPEPINTFLGKIVRFLAKRSLPMVKLEANFTPIQSLNGQEAPWPPGGGVNKIDFTQCTAGKTAFGLTSAISGEYFRFTGTCSSGGAHTWVFGTINSEQQSIAENLNFNGFVISGGSALAITAISYNSSNGGLSVNLGGLVTNQTYDFMLGVVAYEGSTAPTAWSPYSNICPISGHTGCEVYDNGVQQWDEEWEVGGIGWSSGAKYNDNNTIRSKNYFPVKEETEYYAYGNLTAGIHFYDADKNHLGVVGKNNASFTTPSGTAFMMFCLTAAYGTTYNHDISINYPSTDHDYHAYSGTTVAISFGTTVYGGTLTVNEDGSGQIDATMAAVDMGSLEWTRDNGRGGYFWTEITGKKNDSNIISSIYPYNGLRPSSYNDAPIGIYEEGKTNAYIDVRDPRYGTSITQLVAAVTGQMLCYELATPVTIPLTASQINTLVGENVVWVNDSDNIQVTAYGSPIT